MVRVCFQSISLTRSLARLQNEEQWHGWDIILEREFPKLFCGKTIFDDDDDNTMV